MVLQKVTTVIGSGSISDLCPFTMLIKPGRDLVGSLKSIQYSYYFENLDIKTPSPTIQPLDHVLRSTA